MHSLCLADNLIRGCQLAFAFLPAAGVPPEPILKVGGDAQFPLAPCTMELAEIRTELHEMAPLQMSQIA